MTVQLDIFENQKKYSLFEPVQVNLTRYVRIHEGLDEPEETEAKPLILNFNQDVNVLYSEESVSIEIGELPE
jgi:hypothetical protein